MELLKDIFKEQNQTVSEKELHYFIHAIDKNNDGLIQKEEILGLYKRATQSSANR